MGVWLKYFCFSAHKEILLVGQILLNITEEIIPSKLMENRSKVQLISLNLSSLTYPSSIYKISTTPRKKDSLPLLENLKETQ